MARHRKCTKSFSSDEIEFLSQHSEIAEIRADRLRFTLEFRKELYDAWSVEPSPGTIRRLLKEHGIPPKMLGPNLIGHLIGRFVKHGRPANKAHTASEGTPSAYRTSEEGDQRLLASGLFVKRRRGIGFSPDFVQQLWTSYPGQSITDGIRSAGLDPNDVGYQRIYTLERDFQSRLTGESCDAKLGNPDSVKSSKRAVRTDQYSQELIDAYKDHPCIKKISPGQCVFSEAFLNEAWYLYPERTIDEIFAVFRLDPILLTPTRRYSLERTLQEWKVSEARLKADTDLAEQIEASRLKAMEDVLSKNFAAMRSRIPRLTMKERKAYCQWLADFPTDRDKGYTRRRLLKAAGISPSNYYAILKNGEYGRSEQLREERDAADAAVIREVMDYKGFGKGTRQVYMQMKRITGRQFSIAKIRRLKRKFHLTCGIRKPNASRKEMRELMERNIKPNTLKRTFRIHRPGEVVLSDVTYLDYGKPDAEGNRSRYYLSPAMDSVSGKLISFASGPSNDLDLLIRTLEDAGNAGCSAGALYHTDQGILYFTDSFQSRAAALGFVQSMSKRGNSQDNSPCEVLHGNFKAEADYAGCMDEEALRTLLKEYEYYYNYERPQWGRGRMTPVEYEEHLNAMSPEEWDAFMSREKERYERMKAASAAKAIERAKTLGTAGTGQEKTQ